MEKPVENLVEKAREFAKMKHTGMKRDGGEDYFEKHIQTVVKILEQVTNDPEIIAAAYLHDTIEDTETTYDEILKNFNVKIAGLVMEVTHEGNKESGYYFPRLHSKSAILIKFADRTANLSDIEAWPRSRQEQYLKKSKFWRSIGRIDL